MTFGGYCLMFIMCGFFTGLLAWCGWKVVNTPGEAEHLHSTAYEQVPDAEAFEREKHSPEDGVNFPHN